MKKWLVKISRGPQMTDSYVAFSEKDPINDISLDEVIDDLYNNYGYTFQIEDYLNESEIEDMSEEEKDDYLYNEFESEISVNTEEIDLDDPSYNDYEIIYGENYYETNKA